jgi:hypothetical protein
VHSAHSVCRGPGTAPNRPGNTAHNRPQDVTRICAQCVAGLAVARRWPNLGKVYTASFPSPRCTRLTRLRAPARSKEGGRWRGGTHRRGRRRRMAPVVGGSRPRPGKLLRGGWVLRDLSRKKGGGWLGLAMDGEASGADKMHGEGPFYSCVGEGWMGWTG